jgi:hypothetical protein
MKQGDLSLGSARLYDALKKLKLHWEDTRAVWQDQVAQEIERDQLALLEAEVTRAVEAINRLTQVLAQARQEVE